MILICRVPVGDQLPWLWLWTDAESISSLAEAHQSLGYQQVTQAPQGTGLERQLGFGSYGQQRSTHSRNLMSFAIPQIGGRQRDCRQLRTCLAYMYRLARVVPL